MTIQNKAMRMLAGLKGAGITYKEFAQKTGISLDQIYARTSYKVNLTEERAAFYMRAAELYFPEQYKIIKQNIDEIERRFPEM
jgi:predicted DNA-binding transcriptional regulator AlpA